MPVRAWKMTISMLGNRGLAFPSLSSRTGRGTICSDVVLFFYEILSIKTLPVYGKVLSLQFLNEEWKTINKLIINKLNQIMKKFLRTFAIAVAMLLPLMASAQTVTVADGTSTNSYVPVYGLYTDATQRTQSIYPQSMLSDLNGMQITALHYYVSSGSSSNWSNGVFTVKMGITTQADLSSGLTTPPR